MMEGEAGALSWERASPSLVEPTAKLPHSRPSGSLLQFQSLGWKMRQDWLRREKRLQLSRDSLLAHSSGLCPIKAIAFPPPPLLPCGCSRGGRWRLLVTQETVRGHRRSGNCPRPPVSLLRGPSDHPDNCYPFRPTISPSPVTLATVARTSAPLTHRPAPAFGHARPGPPPQGPLAHLRAPSRALLQPWPRVPAPVTASCRGCDSCSHSCVGQSSHHRELFKIQTMSLSG